MLDNVKSVQAIISELGSSKTALLPILLAVQDASPAHYVNEAAINEIAARLKLSRSRVYSTASFYSEISLRPRGRNLVQVCVNAPCENAGKTAILQALESELAVALGETSADARFTLEGVNCLGACYLSPAIKVNGRLYGNLTAAAAIEVIRQCKEAQP